MVQRAAQDWKVEFLLLKVLLLCVAEKEGEMSLVPTQSLTMEYISADFKSGKPSFYLKHTVGGDSAFSHANIMKLPI